MTQAVQRTTSDVHAPASNTAAVLTYAAVSDRRQNSDIWLRISSFFMEWRLGTGVGSDGLDNHPITFCPTRGMLAKGSRG